MKETHSIAAAQDQEFPTDQEVQHNIQSKTLEVQIIEDPVDPSESQLRNELQRLNRPKRSRQTEFKCEYCSNVYTKRYNLKSHLLTHMVDRPFKCEVCGTGFIRHSDYRRHTSTHTGEKRHFCSGVLKSGDRWGCGKSFLRADILSNHHKSKLGQACIGPLLQEREQENLQMQD